MKIKKKFYYEDVELHIVEREELYMNGERPLNIIRVVNLNGNVIPIKIKHKETLKSIVENTIMFLNNMKNMGIDVKSELNK